MNAGLEVRYVSRAALGQGVTKAELSNGLVVLVRENHAAPITTLRCLVRNTGSAYEGHYLGSGVSHILEHMVAMGSTTKRTEQEVQQLLDRLGGRTNASTSADRTAYYLDCRSREVDLAIELIADSVQAATLPESEYEREMGVVQRELEMGQADRQRMLHETIKSLIYTEHPLRHPTIGYLPVVQTITRNDVVAFYRERYVPQNTVFVVVGDIDTDHVLQQVAASFQDFRRTTERSVVLPVEPAQASPRFARLEMEGQTTHFSIAWPTVPLQHPDLYPLDVISDLLTNGDSSRLGTRLRIDQPLSVSVGSFSYTPGFVSGWFEISVECRPDCLQVCREAIVEELERLQCELVGEAELNKVKRQQAAAHVFSQQTVQAQAQALATGFLATGDPRFDDRYLEGVQRVTAEQVREAARRYFLPERRNTVIIDPPGVEHLAEQAATAPVESPVLRQQLDNGLIVLLKRHAVTPIVSIQAFVRAGVLSDTDETSGRAALTSQLMMRGTEQYTGKQIAEYFDSIGGVLLTDSQRNTTYLQCLILKEDLAESLHYAHQVLFRPRLAADEFEKVRRQQLDAIAARKADPQSEIHDFWTTQLPAVSPYHRIVDGTVETVSRLTPADCQEFHRRFVVPNNLVLAIFGDIDPQAILASVRELFGVEPASSGFKSPLYPAEHEPFPARQAHLVSERANTAMVLVSYPTVRITDTRTQDALEVLEAILTGGRGVGGRLFNELRGERLVYHVAGRNLAGPAPGFYFFLAQTLPEMREEVARRIHANLLQIAQHGVPAAEFELVKQKLIVAHAMQNTTPASQAFQAAVWELYGLGYDHDRDYDERIQAVRIEDVQQVVRRHFHNPTTVTSAPSDVTPGSPL